MQTFTLPDLGEGLEEAEILEWNVSEGEHVVVDQPLLTVETDKAVVEIPSPQSAQIVKIHGKIGDVIKVGAPLVEFDKILAKEKSSIVGELAETEIENRENISVFHEKGLPHKTRVNPAVRAMARKLGVELSIVSPSGKDNTITKEDVERAAKRIKGAGPGETLRGMRRSMAQKMTKAHIEVVPASISEIAQIRQGNQAQNITIRLIQAIVKATEKEPSLNAWYSSQDAERQLVPYIDIGIAIDTAEGLIVPVLRNVEKRAARDLTVALSKLRSDVEKRRVPPEELKGATITLSNFGMIGGLFANLVVVPPQVAIVGAGRIHNRVVIEKGQTIQKDFLPLSLTFDHRVVTGGEAARFINWIRTELEQDNQLRELEN